MARIDDVVGLGQGVLAQTFEACHMTHVIKCVILENRSKEVLLDVTASAFPEDCGGWD